MEIKVVVVFFAVFTVSTCSPFKKIPDEDKTLQERLQKLQESMEPGRDSNSQQQEYTRYWEELLSNNPDLAKKFAEMSPEEVAARFGNQFAHRGGNIRSRVDELQRLNLERMKNVNGGRNQQQYGINRGPYNNDRGGQNGKITAEDISSRMSEHRKIQEELDLIRKDEFKRFENKVAEVRKQKLQEMNEAQRLKEEQRLEELAKRHRDHEKMQHPASKQQLEDVWNKQDGLVDEQFNPKTFFYLHDKNGDGFLDIYETEALFLNEIKKVYGDDTDNVIVQEELAEMREHVVEEVDKNKDGLISLSEFLNYADLDVFNTNAEWEPLEQRDEIVFPEDMDEYYDLYDQDMKEQLLSDNPDSQDPNAHASNPDSHALNPAPNPDSNAPKVANPTDHPNPNPNDPESLQEGQAENHNAENSKSIENKPEEVPAPVGKIAPHKTDDKGNLDSKGNFSIPTS